MYTTIRWLFIDLMDRSFLFRLLYCVRIDNYRQTRLRIVNKFLSRDLISSFNRTILKKQDDASLSLSHPICRRLTCRIIKQRRRVILCIHF